MRAFFTPPPGSMSDVSSSRHLRPASCQLPVSWYFDPEVFAREKELLFAAGANYVGHELMVPNVGDYHTLAWQDHEPSSVVTVRRKHARFAACVTVSVSPMSLTQNVPPLVTTER